MNKLTHEKFDEMVEQALSEVSPVEGDNQQALAQFLQQAKTIKAARKE